MYFYVRRPEPPIGVKQAFREAVERVDIVVVVVVACAVSFPCLGVFSRCRLKSLHRRMNGNDGSESGGSGGPGVFVPV